VKPRVAQESLQGRPIERWSVEEAPDGVVEAVDAFNVERDVEMGTVPSTGGLLLVVEEPPAQVDEAVGTALGGAALGLAGLIVACRQS
jgi:hypothetical protein